MKKTIAVTLLIAFTLNIKAQSVENVFTDTNFVWFGIDFYLAKMIGPFDEGMGAGTRSAEKLKANLIPKWNSLFASDHKKFPIHKAFGREQIEYDMQPSIERNRKLDANKLIAYNESILTPAQLQSELDSLEKGEFAEGTGAMFVVNYFNKNEKKASVNVVFFDVATKKMLFSEVMTGNPGGISLVYYWLGALDVILDRIGSGGAYHDWKKKYTKKKK